MSGMNDEDDVYSLLYNHLSNNYPDLPCGFIDSLMKRIYDEFDDDELNVIERLNTFIKSLMHEWKHERNALLLIKWIHLTQTL